MENMGTISKFAIHLALLIEYISISWNLLRKMRNLTCYYC